MKTISTTDTATLKAFEAQVLDTAFEAKVRNRAQRNWKRKVTSIYGRQDGKRR